MAKKQIAKKSTAAKKIAWEFTVQGEYRAMSPNGVVLKHYKSEVFILPEIVEYVSGVVSVDKVVDGKTVKRSEPKISRSNATRVAQHVILRYHLPVRMKEKYPDFKSVRTMEIFKKQKVKVDPSQLNNLSETPIQDMTESDLMQFCAMNDLSVNLDVYGDLADKKIAVETEWNKKSKSKKAIARSENPDEEALSEPEGIFVSEGRVSSNDGVPIDDEDPAEALLG
jgi:hypothetical protein